MISTEAQFLLTIMYSYEYHLKSHEVLLQAKQKYWHMLHPDLSDESIEARYHLLEYLYSVYTYNGTLEKDQEGIPLPLSLHGKIYYWSLSHSENYIAYILSETPTGIDLAEHKDRDLSLLDMHHTSEYEILWSRSWSTFYTLWTAKEAIIKAHGWILDDMKDIKILQTNEHSISTFGFREKIYKIKTIKRSSLILSYIYP